MSGYIIDKKGLEENIALIKEKAGAEVIGVVKGNGYGFGISEFAKTLKENGINAFAVTEVDDISEVRKAVCDSEILVMRSTCIEAEARIIAENDCTATIGSTESAGVMNAVGESLGKKIKCNLKIDTGMGRYGFLPSQVEQAAKCYDLPYLEFTGIYTHFSSAFADGELTRAQMTLFRDTVKQLESTGKNVGKVHAANSPALFNFENMSLDRVRIGSAFTGRLIAQKKTGLNRLGRLEAEVIDTKTVPAGYSIGYCGLYTTKRETEIAIVPIGHYDGFGITYQNVNNNFHSVLSQLKKYLKKEKLQVEVNGRKYDVIGDIGLSHTAIDITGSDVKAGDTASVDISPLLVNPRIKRIYK